LLSLIELCLTSIKNQALPADQRKSRDSLKIYLLTTLAAAVQSSLVKGIRAKKVKIQNESDCIKVKPKGWMEKKEWREINDIVSARVQLAS